MVELERNESEGMITLKVSGIVDERAAATLRQAIAEDGQSAMVVDFSRVKEFYDYAVGMLATNLSTRTPAVTMVGLNAHQRRMFKYFGVNATRRESLTSGDVR